MWVIFHAAIASYICLISIGEFYGVIGMNGMIPTVAECETSEGMVLCSITSGSYQSSF